MGDAYFRFVFGAVLPLSRFVSRLGNLSRLGASPGFVPPRDDKTGASAQTAHKLTRRVTKLSFFHWDLCMSHTNRHRGPNPKDEGIFGNDHLPKLAAALKDYAWLLSNGYTPNASMKLVGDRFKLVDRQRLLVTRCTCSDSQRENRLASELHSSELVGQTLHIDGFNVLITLESALSNGFVFEGVDGCFRDMASIHGTYRRVSETRSAIELVGECLSSLGVAKTHWWLDQPVSNSGRLMCLIDEIAAQRGWSWESELSKSPDYELKQRNEITATADGIILDAVDRWFNLAKHIIEQKIPEARLISLVANQ